MPKTGNDCQTKGRGRGYYSETERIGNDFKKKNCRIVEKNNSFVLFGLSDGNIIIMTSKVNMPNVESLLGYVPGELSLRNTNRD